MNVREYIKLKLQDLAAKFPMVEIVYAYNKYAETHIVQLTPQKEYYNNIELDKAWFNISIDFLQLYPQESLSFVSDDANLINTTPEMEYNIVINTPDSINNAIYSP